MNRATFLSIITCVTCLGACTRLHAQTDFWDSPQAYLGQIPPDNTPVKFAPQLINDTPYFSMDRSAFSPDGKAFYYCRNNTWFSSKNASIQVYRYDGAAWRGPTTLIKQFYAPVFSPAGDTLYLNGGGKGGITEIHRIATGWSEPENYLKRSYGMYDFMPTVSGNMYAGSNIDGSINDYTCYDICIMPPVASGDTSKQTLGKPINTPGFDGDFFVAPDESYIVISAKEHPEYECELYISYHKKDGSWTNPKSLGPEINNGLAHRWGEYVTPDKKYLFYSYGHGPGDCALYWVRFDKLLKNLKYTNFDPYVKTPIAGQNVSAGDFFSLKIPDDAFFDDDGENTLTYSATLSNGDALPAWLTFNADKKIISGTPPGSGTYPISVMATDTAKAMTSCTFLLKVSDMRGVHPQVIRKTHDYTIIKQPEWIIPQDDIVAYAFDTYDRAKALLLKRNILNYKSASIAYPKDLNFKDGIIEADIASPGGSAGFVGLAFRIKDAHHYETVYFRPGSSGTGEAVQYMPEKKQEFDWWDYENSKYEALAVLPVSGWFHTKLVVKGNRLTVFVGNAPKPVFVYDALDAGLKNGSVGFWLGNCTVGAYKNLVVKTF